MDHFIDKEFIFFVQNGKRDQYDDTSSSEFLIFDSKRYTSINNVHR